jgi:uncharacterized lipoprotein YddW (UPF0748 family)
LLGINLIKHDSRLDLFAVLLLIFVVSIAAVVSTAWTIAPATNGGITKIALLDGDESEIRAVFVHAYSQSGIDADLVAETLKDYGVNTIVVEALGVNYARYPTELVASNDFGILPELVTAAHARGMKLYVMMNVLAEAILPDSLMSERYGGRAHATASPVKQATRALIKALVEELVGSYDIDGFMFDYTRYVWTDEPYEAEAKNKFILDTGLSDVNWGADTHVDGGRYRQQFMEWRVQPINELVRDMRNWMLAKKPNLKFSAATWRWPAGYPSYWRYWIGQDSTYWVKEGWLDWVAPMFYTDNVEDLESGLSSYVDTQTGGFEGATQVVPFIDTCVDAVSAPENFANRVNMLRQMGADGWIVWRYGGPGDGQGSNAPDIRSYLSLLQMPNTFAIKNMQFDIGKTSGSISWTTNIEATSKVEYSAPFLFNATFKYMSATNFYYWDVDPCQGDFAEDDLMVTNHTIVLSGLLPRTTYQLRVQSRSDSGLATSQVLTFETK